MITKKELNQWYKLNIQIVNGYHIEQSDYEELLSLNYTVMESAHKIHNDNMLNNNSYVQK